MNREPEEILHKNLRKYQKKIWMGVSAFLLRSTEEEWGRVRARQLENNALSIRKVPQRKRQQN